MKVSNTKSRLAEMMAYFKINQTDIVERTGVPKSSLSLWVNGKRTPGQKQLAMLSEPFNINPAWLMGYDVPMKADEISRRELYNCDAKLIRPSREELMSKDDKPLCDYYIDDDTAQTAQEIFENKDLKLLFEAARTASPEDLKAAQTLLLALKAKEQGRQ